MTTRPDLTAARDALVREYHERMHEDGCDCPASFIADPIDNLIALARAEAGVSVEALRQAFLDIEYPEVFADGESRRLSAALAARSAGSGSRVERVKMVPHPDGGYVADPSLPCPECGLPSSVHFQHRPTPPPAVDVHALAESASAQRATKVDAEYHALRAARPTPPPAVDGTRCGECGGVKDDVFHVPCLVGGPFHYVKTCHPFTPPTPAPADRLRALEAALERLRVATNRLMQAWAERPLKLLPGVMDEALTATAAARDLLADGEGSRS